MSAGMFPPEWTFQANCGKVAASWVALKQAHPPFLWGPNAPNN